MHYSQYPPSQYQYPPSPASFSSWGTIDTRSPDPARPKSRASYRPIPLPPQSTPWSPASSETYSCHSHFDDTMTRFSTPTLAPLRPVPLPNSGTPVTARGHVGRMSILKRDPNGFTDANQIALHPSLANANICCNIMDPTTRLRSRGGNPLNPNDLACQPPVSQLHIRVSTWPIITITNPAGVTLGDVIRQIQNFFQSPISPHEVRSLGAGSENAIVAHAQSRRSRYPGSPHISRGDVLGQWVWFYGLNTHPDGVSFEAVLGNSPN
jgi:hypothetical protein